MVKSKHVMIIFMIFAFTSILLSCDEQVKELDIEEDLLTRSEILEVLEDEYDLDKVETDPPVDIDELRDKSNVLYDSYGFSEMSGELIIYIFESIEERAEHFSHDYSYTAMKEEEEGIDYVSLNAQNAAILYQPSNAEMTDVMGKAGQLSDFVYYQLNDITEVNYRGEGENWQVELDASYYDYELDGEDENSTYGIMTYENTYIGEHYEEVVDMMMYYYHSDGKGRRGGGRGGGEPFLDEGESVPVDFSGDILPDGLGDKQKEVIVEWEKAGEEFEEVIKLDKIE